MLLDDKPYTFDRVFRIMVSIAAFAGLIWVMHYLSDVLILFAVALLLAYLLNPLVQRVQKVVSNRGAAVVITFAICAGVLTVAVWLVVPRMAAELSRMGKIATSVVEIEKLEDDPGEYLPDAIWEPIEDFLESDEVQEFLDPDKRGQAVLKVVNKVLPGVWGLMSGTFALILEIVGLAVVLLYLFFLLLDYEKVKNWRDLLPTAYRDKVSAFVADFEGAMSSYFRGQATVAFISAILFAIGFAIVGLPLAIFLGLLFGLLNMVPYLQLVGLIPAGLLCAVYSVETEKNFLLILGYTGLAIMAVQIVQDLFLVPRIMGRAMKLSPAMIILSLSIWGKLLGFLGLIIALPVSFLILAYYRRFLVAYGDRQAAAEGSTA